MLDLDKICCLNRECKLHKKIAKGNIKSYGSYTTSNGKHKRLLCKECKKTFSLTKGTAYYRLKKSKKTFDSVAKSSVEGIKNSVNARINAISPTTVWRWLILASKFSKSFSDKNLRDYTIREIQADELKTFVSGKDKESWIYTAMEVSTRLWPSFVLGTRTYRNTMELLSDFQTRGTLDGNQILITTDGFGFYKSVIPKVFSPLAIHAQVIKKIRKNRITKVDERLIIGTEPQLKRALADSSDSEKINTSFIERLNLTLRQGVSYLQRKTSGYSRHSVCLEERIFLFQCFYNFIRPHRSLSCKDKVVTPAMAAGITSLPIDFRTIFSFFMPNLWAVTGSHSSTRGKIVIFENAQAKTLEKQETLLRDYFEFGLAA